MERPRSSPTPVPRPPPAKVAALHQDGVTTADPLLDRLRSFGIPYTPRTPSGGRGTTRVRHLGISPPATAPDHRSVVRRATSAAATRATPTPFRDLYPHGSPFDAPSSARAFAQAEQKELSLVTVPQQEAPHHSTHLAHELHQLAAQLEARLRQLPGGGGALSARATTAALAAHGRAVQCGLTTLRRLGGLLGAEGASIAHTLGELFALAIFTSDGAARAPTAFADTPQQTHRQQVINLQQRLQTAEATAHALLQNSAQVVPSPPARSPPTPDVRVASTSVDVGKPTITLERFYKQLDLLSQNLVGSDALEGVINDLRQDLYRADVQAHHMVKEKKDLQRQLELLNSALMDRDRLHQEEALNASPIAGPAGSASNVAGKKVAYTRSNQFVLEDSEEFKALWVKYQQSLEKTESLQSQLKIANRVCEAHRAQAQKCLSKESADARQLDSLKSEVSSLKNELSTRLRPLTPRPDWKKYPVLDVASGPQTAWQVRKAREFEACLASGGKDLDLAPAPDAADVSPGGSRRASARTSASNSPAKSARRLSMTSRADASSPILTSMTIPSAAASPMLQPADTASAAPSPNLVSASSSSPSIPVMVLGPALSWMSPPASSPAPLLVQVGPALITNSAPTALEVPAPLPPTTHTFFPPPPGNEGLEFPPTDPSSRAVAQIEFDANGNAIPSSLAESTQSRLLSLYVSYREAINGREVVQERAKQVIRALQAELGDTKGKLSTAEAYLSDAAQASIHAGAHVGVSFNNSPAVLEPREDMRTRHSTKFFIGLGLDAEVPPYLRAIGKIRKKFFSKKECEALVKQVLAAREEYLRDPKSKPVHIGEFFHIFLNKKFGVRGLVLECSYGMIDALELYRWDSDCHLFLKLLRGDLHESVLSDQNAMLAKLMSLCEKLDLSLSGRLTGKVPKTLLLYTLRNLFPLKGNAELHEMSKCLNADQPGPTVDYTTLFAETASFDQGLFAERIRDGHLQEVEDMMIEIQDRVGRACEENEDGQCSLLDVRKAWASLDPLRPLHEVDACLALATDSPDTSSLIWESRITPARFFKKLFARTMVKRTRNFAADAKPHLPHGHNKNGGPQSTLHIPLGALPTTPSAVVEADRLLREDLLQDRSSVSRRASLVQGPSMLRVTRTPSRGSARMSTPSPAPSQSTLTMLSPSPPSTAPTSPAPSHPASPSNRPPSRLQQAYSPRRRVSINDTAGPPQPRWHR